jgi:glutathione peroxidase
MFTIHHQKITNLEGKELDFSTFAGKKLLIVNIASACGYTPQYQQLQELWEHYSDRLTVVGCPCNDFGGQEPDDATSIRVFCTVRYGASFPLSEKINILTQPQHPLYAFLTKKELNGMLDSEVKWNFQKYLLDESGYLVKMLPSSVSPLDEEILDWLG